MSFISSSAIDISSFLVVITGVRNMFNYLQENYKADKELYHCRFPNVFSTIFAGCENYRVKNATTLITVIVFFASTLFSRGR